VARGDLQGKATVAMSETAITDLAQYLTAAAAFFALPDVSGIAQAFFGSQDSTVTIRIDAVCGIDRHEALGYFPQRTLRDMRVVSLLVPFFLQMGFNLPLIAVVT